MFKKFTNGCVKLVQRFLPDAFVFCIILTIVVFIAAMPGSRYESDRSCKRLGIRCMGTVSILYADGTGSCTW